MKRVTTILALTLIFTVLGCSKDTSPTTANTPTPTTDYFPLKVGNWWKYNNGIVTITIDSVAPLADNTQAYWMNYNYSTSGNKLYFYKKDSTQIAEYEYTGQIRSILLKLPIQIGQKWQYDSGISSVESLFVIGKENITVPAGTFNDCLRLEIYSYSNNVKTLDEVMLLGPNIGKVMWTFDGVADSIVLSSRLLN